AEPEPSAVEADEEEEAKPEADTEREMLRQGVVTGTAEGEIILRRTEAGPETRLTPSVFRAAFTHALRLRKAGGEGSRRANIRAVLLRYTAFFAAYPDRALSARSIDAPLRAELTAFLREIAGRRRDPVAVRLRRAADAFANTFSSADMEAARTALREAV